MFVYVQESQLVECLKNISKIEAIESGAVKILQGKRLENAIRNLKTFLCLPLALVCITKQQMLYKKASG